MTDENGGGPPNPNRPARSEFEENCYRLLESPRCSEVFAKLRRHGWDDDDVKILIGQIARIPRNWRYENEPLPEANKRRERLGKALRRLAKIIASDRDLGGLHFNIINTGFYITENTPPDAVTLARLLEIGANLIAPVGTPSTQPISPVDSSRLPALRLHHPARRPLLKSYAVGKIFEKLAPRFQRAPNKEAEILAEVLLKKPIKRGATTRLRKKARRKYNKG